MIEFITATIESNPIGFLAVLAFLGLTLFILGVVIGHSIGYERATFRAHMPSPIDEKVQDFVDEYRAQALRAQEENFADRPSHQLPLAA